MGLDALFQLMVDGAHGQIASPGGAGMGGGGMAAAGGSSSKSVSSAVSSAAPAQTSSRCSAPDQPPEAATAARTSQSTPSTRRTYGFHRSTILAALANAASQFLQAMSTFGIVGGEGELAGKRFPPVEVAHLIVMMKIDR